MEIQSVNMPKIDAKGYYPKLTEYGVEIGYNEITIDYFPTSVQRLYKIDDGEWQEYCDRTVKLEFGQTIYAKGIDKYGIESMESSYNSTMTDALGLNAYDGNESTYFKNSISAAYQYFYLYIDSSLYNKYVYYKKSVIASSYYGADIYALDEEGNTLYSEGTGSVSKTNNILIPEGTYKLGFRLQGNAVINEVSISSIPAIIQQNIYPNLTTNGMDSYNIKTKINYLSYLPQKLYSLDNGTTWLEYKEPFEVKVGNVVKAKAIKEDGTETSIASLTVAAISDMLSSEAYDNNYETYTSIAKTTSKVFTVSEDTVGRKVRVFLNSTPATNSYIKIYDANNTELESITLTSKITLFDLPDNAYKVLIYSGSSILNITEVNLREVFEVDKDNAPIITTNDVNWTTSKVVDITYNENYINEYSIDLGTTWLSYESPITLAESTTIFARSKDSDGNIISTSSFAVSKVDSVEPTIELDIPDMITLGSDYKLPTTYITGTSGGNPTCKINGTVYTNTESLEAGSYTIECSITNGVGITKNINKDIVIYTVKELSKAVLDENQLIEAEPTLTTSSNNTSDASGLYKSTDTNSGEATYYFRGNVKNNYISFAGFTWRIVRINEDGTVRLIMQEGINNNTTYLFNSNYNDYTYMYYKNSESKTTLESWYTSNLSSYNDKIATGDYYCEQAKIAYNDAYATNSGADMTVYSSYTPNFKCETDTNGYGIVNSNIGLLTYDEVVYAGGYYNSSNDSYYLHNNSIYWWTMSPAGFSDSYAIIWRIGTVADLYYGTANDPYTIRPVINLKSDVTVTGTGTSTDPYVVK